MGVPARQPPEIRSIHERRFGALLGEVVTGNPFYREKFEAAGLRVDKLVGLSDCRNLPLISRQDLVEDQLAHPPFGTIAGLDPRRYTRLHRSKEDGRPALWWLDTPESWSWQQDCWRSVYEAAAVDNRDRVVVCTSLDARVADAAALESAERLGALALAVSCNELLRRQDDWLALQPTVLIADAEDARTLAGCLRDRFGDAPRESLRRMIVPVERDREIEAVAAEIGELWKVLPLFQIGGAEIGTWGFTCEAGTGLHVNETEFIVEVVDPVSLDPASSDESGMQYGEVVLTNLGRPCSPLIRYRTGIVAEVRWRECGCGLRSAVLHNLTAPAPACP